MTEQEKTRQAQREYYKQWREANPEKVKECNRRYWLNRAEKLKNEQREVQTDDIDGDTNNQ
jgi:hypothetical protein